MNHITFISRLPKVDSSTLEPHDQQCSVCLVQFPSTSPKDSSPRYNLRSRAIPARDPKNTGEKAVRLPCSHLFGSQCIEAWLANNNTCPMCRVAVIDYPLTKDLATLIAYSHEFPGTIETEYPNQDLLMRVQEKFIDAFEAGTDTPEASTLMKEFRKAHESFLLRVPKLTLPGVITFWALAVPPEVAQEEEEFFVEKIGEVIGLYFFEGEPAEFVRRLVESESGDVVALLRQ